MVKSTSGKNYVELLEVFHIGLTNGLLDKQEVIKWADNIIQQEEQPDYFVIELSLCGNKSVNEILTLLNEFIDEPKPIISGRIILGLLYKEYKNERITLKKVVSSLYWIVLNEQITEEEKRFMYGLDDEYDLVFDNTPNAYKQIERATTRFIEIYKDFRIDNFEQWNEINKTIDKKVADLSEIVDRENKS